LQPLYQLERLTGMMGSMFRRLQPTICQRRRKPDSGIDDVDILGSPSVVARRRHPLTDCRRIRGKTRTWKTTESQENHYRMGISDAACARILRCARQFEAWLLLQPGPPHMSRLLPVAAAARLPADAIVLSCMQREKNSRKDVSNVLTSCSRVF
jgi:hypothetical protein